MAGVVSMQTTSQEYKKSRNLVITVRGISSKLLGIKFFSTRQQLQVRPSAINLLFVLHGVLNNKILLLGAVEGLGKRSGETIESSVLGGFDALIIGSTAVEFSCCVGPFAEFGVALPVRGAGPSFFPALKKEKEILKR